MTLTVADAVGASIPVTGDCIYSRTISEILSGAYQGEVVTTMGLIVDYFDYTLDNGPHSITITEESSGSNINLVIWPNDWNDEYASLVQFPLFTKGIVLRV